MKTKKSNKIFLYLRDYFGNLIEEDKEISKECDSFFEPANALYDLKKITLEENDLICDNMCALIEFVLFTISGCPNIEIHIDKTNY